MDIRDLFELENDTSFQQLNQQVNSFNVLKILKLENHEIRHSNVLAWLLSPKENHGLQDYFLRKMMEHLMLIDENYNNTIYEAVGRFLHYSLVDSYVYREVKTDNNRYIDLVIINQQLKFVLLIENKFYSTESENQLDDYLNYIQDYFSDFTVIPIYLTLDGEEPSNEQYFILTYERIEAILHTLLMSFQNQLSNRVYTFIENYNQLLRERYNPNQDQIVKAIEIYRNHKSIIDALFQRISSLPNGLLFESGYPFEFMTKYKNTIQYIYKHGQNILSYSFEQFIHQQFNKEVLYHAHPTVPHLLPPEWHAVSSISLKEANYWLGKGLIVWFEQTKDNRLRLIAEIGPMEYTKRLWLLEQLEKVGVSIKSNSKLEKARYTRFFSQKMDINKWDDMEELTRAMIDLYDGPKFAIIREQVATILNSKNQVKDKIAKRVETSVIDKTNVHVQQSFENWMFSKGFHEKHYRVSTRNLSFKIPLFDSFKGILGETREKWWWHNGPFLFWINVKSDSLYFTLEIGPIESDKRVLLMKKVKKEGITFNKKGLMPEAKYTRIYTATVPMVDLKESDLLNIFDTLYDDNNLQEILEKLQKIYDEWVIEMVD
ncbi:PD-(D/E)XK nuclease family protein [Oceanobacillus caeni]|uniref:PDDEXK-like family protein n=1 Tax=Oceanobacillus TaxID=182709 RepID=UPI00214A53AE|nr:PD-(D/E)XK nuclease family protein [Oceanobacillus caeni]MCR1834068.1 PD-(D/E)XK nuclease family protein [Oceanobacillus caeni]